jgi:hypothetical protein
MHKNAVVVVAGVVALLMTATSTQAGFVSINLDSPDGELIGTAVNIDAGTGNATVATGEVFQQGQASFRLDVTGETDADPVMSISKTIENTTGLEWTGYQLDLDPGGTATFTGTPSSDVFTFDAGASSPISISFVPPSTVPSGSSVTVNFDILVPDEGPFGFTITQTPIVVPEPGAILLGLLAAGAGSAVALRYRWG